MHLATLAHVVCQDGVAELNGTMLHETFST
jgi:hypothetical protein